MTPEGTTLAGADIRSRPEHVAESLPVLDRPLGVFENAMILTHQHSPFNVVIVVGLAHAPAPATLRSALDALQRRQPALRCRLAGPRGHWRFLPSEERLPLAIELRTGPDQWRSAAEEELARRLPLARGPLAHARYLRDDSGRAELILTLVHAIVDAASADLLVDELLARCSGAAVDATPLAPLPLLEQRFPARFRGLAGRLRTASGILRSLGSELAFQLRTRGAGLPGVDSRARSRIVTRELAADSTARLVRRCRRHRVTLNSALAAALLLALRQVRRAGRRLPARLYTMADLRAYVAPSVAARSLGAGWAMMRFVVEPGDCDDLWPLARAVNDQIRARLRAGEKFLSYLSIRALMRAGLAGRRLRMGEVALSYSGPTAIVARYGAIAVTALEVFVSNIDLGPECSVQARLRESSLQLDLVYLDTDMDGATAQALATAATAALGADDEDAARGAQ